MTDEEIGQIAYACSLLPRDLKGRHPAVLDALRWFRWNHLPEGLSWRVSRECAALAA